MSLLGFAVIATLALFWLALPFLPALVELRRRHTFKPLPIPAGYEGDIQYFAKRFKEYVASETSNFRVTGTFEQVVGKARAFPPFVAPKPLVVDREWVCPADIYASKSVFGWDGVVYRGLLANRDVVLGRRSVILRWIHSAASLRVGAESALLGRVSAEGALRVAEGTTFGWLAAPRIEFGAPEECRHARRPPRSTGVARGLNVSALRRVDGDLEIAADSEINEDLVVTGAVRVGPRSVMRGSIKSHGTLHVGEGATVLGSLISSTDIVTAPDCAVCGVVVAERSIAIGGCSLVGSKHVLSSVSAPEITVGSGAVVHGTVWARTAGSVESARRHTVATRS